MTVRQAEYSVVCANRLPQDVLLAGRLAGLLSGLPPFLVPGRAGPRAWGSTQARPEQRAGPARARVSSGCAGFMSGFFSMLRVVPSCLVLHDQVYYEVEEKTNDPHVISELPAKIQFPLCNLYTFFIKKVKIHRVEAVVALHKPCRNKFTFCVVLTSTKI